MCYNTAAAAKAAAIQALRSGILILLVPVVLMFIGIFIMAFRSRERFSELSPEGIDDNRELSAAFDKYAMSARPLTRPSATLSRGERAVIIKKTNPLPVGPVGEGGPAAAGG